MSEHDRLPEALRRAVTADLKPVRPLPRPGVRALEVALWGVVMLLALPALFGVRGDAVDMGWLLTWGAAILQVAAGVLLVFLALAEAVPGAGIGRRRAVAALLGGVAVQVAVGMVTWMSAGGHHVAGHSGARCMTTEAMLGLPALAVTLWLAVRALPVRPRWAGALAGLGAGLMADGAWHLVCPATDLEHLLLWHGAASAIMTSSGFLLGLLWEHRQVRRLLP